MSARGVEIVGLGHYAPAQIITSAALEADMGLSSGWIERRTGIISRRYAANDEALSDIAQQAAEMALAQINVAHSKVARGDVGLLLLATSTPDHLLPPTAPLLAHRLGLAEAGAIDLTGACSGFLYALALADAFVRTHTVPVLVVAANILSRRINPLDRGSAVLFADAAGAVLLAPTYRPDAGIRGLKLAAKGADYGLIHIPAGGSRRPLTDTTPLMDTRMVMADGKAVYQKAIAMMAQSSAAALHMANATARDVAHFIPHQANARMIEALRADLDITPQCTALTVAEFGNSSAATIPFTLSMRANERHYQSGDLMLMTAAGAGLAGGAIAWGW